MPKPKIKEPTSYSGILVVLVIALLCIGLIMLYSTTNAEHGMKYLRAQGIFITLGATGAFLLSRFIDYRKVGSNSGLILFFVLVPLSYLVLARALAGKDISLPLVQSIKGAYRWIKLPGFSIQVSEFAKIAFIIYLAKVLEKNQLYFKQKIFVKKQLYNRIKILFTKTIFPITFVFIVIMAIFLGKNLSVTIVSTMVVLSMALVAGIKFKYILLGITLAYFSFVLDNDILKTKYILSSNRERRLISYKNPEAVKADEGFQLWRSQLALGSGGLTGAGLTNGIMKNNYIPEPHTDFILAIVGEELGFTMLILILSLYVGVAVIGIKIADRAVDQQGAFLAIGCSTSILLHALVNFSVMCGLFPTTGLTAPFISYGGSSMIANFIALGLILSVEHKSKLKRS